MSTPELRITAPCNLCHSDDFTVLYGPGVAQVNQIVRCKTCGLMYANPRREADHVDMASWPDDPNWDPAREIPQRFEKEILQVRDYASTRALVNRLHPGRGKLVEVGSSLGFALEAFRKDGWDVLGVDPDRNGCRHAGAKLSIPTINSILEDARLPSDSVDVVVMLHVIEHVPDPVGTLREINRVLRPGGHLVLETPRYDTLSFRLLGRRERSLSCNGHIFFFTTDSLRRACTLAGFEIVDLEYVGRSMTLARMAFNLGVMSKSGAVQRAVRSLSRRTLFSRIRFTISLRDMQRLCLQKTARPATIGQPHDAGRRENTNRTATIRSP